MRSTTQLRQLLKSTPLVVPGCYDAMSAKVLERAGFPAVYMTGYGTSLALLGLPDAGLATMSEMHLNARYIANAVAVPVIADADNGYGNAINVMRTVREYIQTGVAGIHIEDQAIPKRCGHVAGRRVIPIEEAVGKYRAAAAVRARPRSRLRAHRPHRRPRRPRRLARRGDPPRQRLPGGRRRPRVRRGARPAWTRSRRVCREVRGPVFYNQTGVSPRLTPDQMKELGIAVTILPGATLRVALQAIWDFAAALRAEGPAAEARFAERFKDHPVGDLHTFAGFDQIRAWEAEYLPAEEQEKYEGSVGHQPTRR